MGCQEICLDSAAALIYAISRCRGTTLLNAMLYCGCESLFLERHLELRSILDHFRLVSFATAINSSFVILNFSSRTSWFVYGVDGQTAGSSTGNSVSLIIFIMMILLLYMAPFCKQFLKLVQPGTAKRVRTKLDNIHLLISIYMN